MRLKKILILLSLSLVLVGCSKSKEGEPAEGDPVYDESGLLIGYQAVDENGELYVDELAVQINYKDYDFVTYEVLEGVKEAKPVFTISVPETHYIRQVKYINSVDRVERSKIRSYVRDAVVHEDPVDMLFYTKDFEYNVEYKLDVIGSDEDKSKYLLTELSKVTRGLGKAFSGSIDTKFGSVDYLMEFDNYNGFNIVVAVPIDNCYYCVITYGSKNQLESTNKEYRLTELQGIIDKVKVYNVETEGGTL